MDGAADRPTEPCATITVLGFHTDSLGHVNNARYLEFLEEARWHYLLRHGFRELLDTAGASPVMVNANVDYLAAAVPEDVLELGVAISHVSHRSFRLHQTIHRRSDHALVVRATLTFVLVADGGDGAIPLPAPVREQLQALRVEPDS